MKIKKILSLVCSVTLIATAFTTGAIVTKADDGTSAFNVKVDFNNYTINGTNANATNFSIDESDNNLKFSCTDEDLTAGSKNTFLLSEDGKNSPAWENNTTYSMKIKYKFSVLNEITDNIHGVCPYIAFDTKLSSSADTGSLVTDPVNGLWTKYGYYNRTNKASGSQFENTIGFYDLESSKDGNVWNTADTDAGYWTTATLDFTTNGEVEGKNMYFGFVNGCGWQGGQAATVEYYIEYIEITKADGNEADAYAANKNTYLDFSGYYRGGGNCNSGVSIVASSDVTGATGSNVAKIYKSSAPSAVHTYFRANLTGSEGRKYWCLKKGNTYQLEMRYKLVNSSQEMGINIGFSDITKSWNFNQYNSDTKLTFGNESGKGMTVSNPCGSFWEEAVIDNNGWVTAKLQFTAPDVCDGQSYETRFGLAFSGSDSKLEMYIDYINIKLTAPVTVDGEVKLYAVPGESMASLANTKENYAADSATATAVETKYYSDAEKTNQVDLSNAKFGCDTKLYSETVTVIDNENQVAFCGFDEYKLRTKQEGAGFAGDFWKEGYDTATFEITKEDKYTGTSSLRYESSKDDVSEADPKQRVVYIGNGYELKPGKTYMLSFWYKPAEGNTAQDLGYTFTSGSTRYNYAQSDYAKTYGLDLTGSGWKQATCVWTCKVVKDKKTFYDDAEAYNKAISDSDDTTNNKLLADWCAPVLKLSQTTDTAKVYFDSFAISEVASYEGAAMLESDKLDNGKQAIRFKYSYDTVAGTDKVNVSGKEYTVKERGILVKSIENTAELVCGATANGVIKSVKTSGFEDCWNYNSETGKYEYSMYIKGLAADDSRELVSRAYVVLTDESGNETVFYTEESKTSIEKIKAGLAS